MADAPIALIVGPATYGGELTAGSPDVPVAAVRPSTELAGTTPARHATTVPETGAWVLAVWRTESGSAFAPGHFRGTASVTCGASDIGGLTSSVTLSHAMVGGGLFDLDGALLGVIAPCDEQVAVVAVDAVHALLDHAGATEQRIIARFGASLGVLSAGEAAYFKRADGLLVREVRSDQPADVAGLRPGDIVIALRDTPVVGAHALEALALLTDLPIALTVQREGRPIQVSLGAERPSRGSTAAAALGLTVSALSAPRIDTVAPDSPAAAAGLRAGDVLVRVNQAEVRSLEQVTLLLSRATMPVWLEIDRGRRRLGLLVSPVPRS
ncbi:MAG: PDZ domain-containing protein [Acidobacteriota bacterium]